MRPRRQPGAVAIALAAWAVGCGARTELAAPAADGGTPPACGAAFSCPPPGTGYDCMPPETPELEHVCAGACHDWIVAHCPGVGFAY